MARVRRFLLTPTGLHDVPQRHPQTPSCFDAGFDFACIKRSPHGLISDAPEERQQRRGLLSGQVDGDLHCITFFFTTHSMPPSLPQTKTPPLCSQLRALDKAVPQ